jgi:hypothetical protein
MRPAIPATLAVLLMAVLWIVMVGDTSRHEMWVGGAVVLLSAAFLYKTWQTETLKLDLRARDLAQGWRIPWYIASGVWEMILILVKDLFGRTPAGSFYRVSVFRKARSGPRFAARRVLATAFTTTAPNFIVIGIDSQQDRMLFHQLERSSVPKLTQALGAQPGVAKR